MKGGAKRAPRRFCGPASHIVKQCGNLQLRVFAVEDAHGRGPAVAIEQWTGSGWGKPPSLRKRYYLLPAQVKPFLTALEEAATDLGVFQREPRT